MNDKNAAQAAEQDPLSDQFVNAVIRQHGYDSPEAVIARLWQWIGLNGSENGVTLLMYEAHKALSKLRAPVADERDDLRGALRAFTDFAAQRRAVLGGLSPEMEAIERRAIIALASAPVATEDGYRLVPTEPTHAMLQALSGEWHSSKHEQARANYSAMLKAAPVASAPVALPKRPPVDDGICWSSKEIQRRQKEEDEARAAYYHSRASAPVAPQACPTDVCQAAKADGVLCANDECDRANGVRPDNTAVICPSCAHQFRAIPVQVQNLLRGAGYKAPFLDASAVTDERAAVAYLDLGAGGYMDVGTDLTDEQLAALPKGRHMLAIIGTHGVDGYTPASAPIAGEAQPVAWRYRRASQKESMRLAGREPSEAEWHLAPHATRTTEMREGSRYNFAPSSDHVDWEPLYAAPQASEAVRGQDAGDVVAVLVYRSKGRPGAHGQTLGANGAGEFAVVYRGDEFAALVKANEEIRALEAAGHRLDFAAIIHGEGYSGPMLRQKYVTRAALSAQPADKPAISSPSSAGNPCPAPVPAYPETGNSHTDGGAVYG